MIEARTPAGRLAVRTILAAPGSARAPRLAATLSLALAAGLAGCRGVPLGRAPAAIDVARPTSVVASAGDRGASEAFDRALATPASTHAIPASNSPSATDLALWAEAPVAPAGDYEVDVNLGLGLAFPGNQDLKFKRFDASGALIDNLFSADVTENHPMVETLSVELWRTRGFLADFGLRLSGVHWNTTVKANSFEDKLAGGSTSPVPPFDTIEEDRFGVYLSLEKRFWLARDGDSREASPYAYVGLGAGQAYSDVTHGESQWGSSLEGYFGFSVPVADRLRLRLEGLLLVAHDVDLTKSYSDWKVETSGIRTSLPNAKNFAHLDTWFLAVTIGVEYRL